MPAARIRSVATIGLMCAIVAVIAYFSLQALTETPPIWYDEGIYSQTAQHALRFDGAPRIQVAPGMFESAWNSSGGFPFIYPVAISYALLGESVFAGRLTMVFFLLSLSIALFFLIKRLHGTTTAIASLLLLATFPVLYGTGKSVLGEVPGLLYLTLFLLLLAGFEHRAFRASVPYVFLCGLTLGLTAVTKPLFLLVPIALAIVSLINIRAIAWQWRWVIAGALGALLPVTLHVYVHLLDAPFATLLQFYANPYALEQVSSTVGENLLRLVTEVSPLHCVVLFLLWAARLLWCVYRKLAVSLAEQTAFVITFLVLLSYLRTAGWYRYFFVADILSLIFLPISLITLRDAVVGFFPRLFLPLSIGAALFAASLFALHTHALLYRSWIAEHKDATATRDVSDRIASLPTQTSLALLDVPELAIIAHAHPYYQYMMPTAVFTVGTSTLAQVTAGVPDVVIVRRGQDDTYRSLLADYVLVPGASSYQFYERRTPHAE